ncbi:aminotransferase class V-fold PLP-dependent enzyme [Bacteroidota bacterium]
MERRRFLGTVGIITGGAILGHQQINFSMPSSLKEFLTNETDNEVLWKTIREQFVFPKDYIYLNTGGIGAVPSLVLKDVDKNMYEDEIYPSAGHDLKKWLEVKEKCSTLLSNDCHTDELALVSTATEGINIIISGLPLKEGDEVITSSHEHPAVHIPLLNKMKRDGIKIRVFEPDLKNSHGNVERIEKLVNKKTRLIFISHITCTTGQCFPLKEIGELARLRNIWFAVDAAQAAGTIPEIINNMDIDFYTFSGHKWTLGPKRTGVLYVRKDLLDLLKPTYVGAYSDDGYDINKGDLKYNSTAQRYEYATQNESLFIGLGTAVDFINTIGIQKIREHNIKLAEEFYFSLKKLNGVQVMSPEEKQYRSAIISFKISELNNNEVAGHFSKKRIRVRVVHEAGLDCIRVSFHLYNTHDDLEKIINEINFLVKG